MNEKDQSNSDDAIELRRERDRNYPTPASLGEITALLGKGADFQGRLVFEGIVRIDGNFRGDIFSRDTLIIGAESRVFANIEADTVLIAGYVEGDVKALSRVEIHATGYVKGSVSAPIFKIEEGGMFDGSTQMLPKDV